MTTHIINPNAFNITKTERVRRKTVFDELLKQHKPSNCLSSSDFNPTSFDDLKKFIGNFDLELLLQLTISKISSFSPANFNDFLKYMDESYVLLSCLWDETLDTVNNTSSPSKGLDLSFNLEALLFDFFKKFREAIRAAGEKLIVLLVKKIFLEVLNLIDCNRINRCVVPCSPERNPFKNIYAKLALKEGTNLELYLESKIRKNNLSSINRQDLKKLLSKTLESIVPEEFECLLKGFRSTKLIKFLMDLFNSLFGPNAEVNDTVIYNIIEDIDTVVDIIPGSIDLLPADPCGIISMEALARARLIRGGKTEEEADEIILQTIMDGRDVLEPIVQLLQRNPFKIELDTNENADIVKTIVKRSVDNIFDGIDVNRRAAEVVLKKILIKPTGEIGLAYFWTIHPNTNNLGIDLISEYLASQIKPPNSSLYGALLAAGAGLATEGASGLLASAGIAGLLGDSAENNFYTKYLPLEKESSFTLKYEENGNIIVYSDNIAIFLIEKSKITDLEDQFFVSLPANSIESYINMNNRNNISNIFEGQNDDALSKYFTLKIDALAGDIYKNTLNFINNKLGKYFYFQEFNTATNTAPNKVKFSQIDYFDIANTKEKIKEKLNV